MIYLATDHRGFNLKEKIKQWLTKWEIAYKDLGAVEYNPTDDYTDFVRLAAEAVSKDSANARAIILGGSGQGEAIVANRHAGIRAAVFYGGSEDIIRLSRQHNDANVLSLGASFIDETTAEKIIKLWLDTPFSGDERHVRRIKKIDQ